MINICKLLDESSNLRYVFNFLSNWTRLAEVVFTYWKDNSWLIC
jgi:hypothetical protein